MKIRLLIGLMTAVALASLVFQVMSIDRSRLQIYQGSVTILRQGHTFVGQTGSAIRPHDTLHVAPDSRVAVVFRDGTIVRLEAGSEATLAELTYRRGRIARADWKLAGGRLWSNVAPLAPSGHYQVETPSVVAAVQGTVFNTDYLAGGLSQIYVAERAVSVTSGGKEQTIKQDGLLRLHADRRDTDFTAGPIIAPPEFFDDWMVFNQTLDYDQAHPGQSQGLVPAKITGLSIRADTTTLHVGESTVLHATVTYATGATREIGDIVEWPDSAFGTFDQATLTATHPGTIDLVTQAAGVYSNHLAIRVIQATASSAAPTSTRRP